MGFVMGFSIGMSMGLLGTMAIKSMPMKKKVATALKGGIAFGSLFGIGSFFR